MDNESIKRMLLQIKPTELDFSLVLTGKKSSRVNGLYKPDTREILLHNKNFSSDGELIYTAIHEYTHHLLNEESLRQAGGVRLPYKSKCHTTHFWATFHELLEIAEAKGFYKLDLSLSPELEELTREIREKYIEPGGQMMQQFGKCLVKAHALCQEANIRYEDYLDRVLQIPRTTAKSAAKVGFLPDEDTKLGFDNMKIVASLKKPEEKAQAVDAIKSGKSPDSVIAMMKKKVSQRDPRQQLEKEKERLVRTINELTQRLEYVEESLANL